MSEVVKTVNKNVLAKGDQVDLLLNSIKPLNKI